MNRGKSSDESRSEYRQVERNVEPLPSAEAPDGVDAFWAWHRDWLRGQIEWHQAQIEHGKQQIALLEQMLSECT